MKPRQYTEEEFARIGKCDVAAVVRMAAGDPTFCLMWADSAHCFEVDYIGDRLVSKVCACGATVEKRP